MFPRALYMLGFHHESHIPVIHPVMAMSCFRLLALLNKAAVLKVMQTSLQDSSFNCFYLDLEVVVDNIVILLSIVLRTMVPFFFFFFFLIMAVPFSTTPAGHEDPRFSVSLPVSFICLFGDGYHPNECEAISPYGSDLHFAND